MNVFVRRQAWAAAALAVSLLAPRAGAQALPDAKELIAKYNKAVGGEAWKAHKSAKMKAVLEVPAQGVRAEIEAMNIFATKNFIMKTDLPGLGQMLAGYDGATAWSKDPMQGARLLTGNGGVAGRRGSGPGIVAADDDEHREVGDGREDEHEQPGLLQGDAHLEVRSHQP